MEVMARSVTLGPPSPQNISDQSSETRARAALASTNRVGDANGLGVWQLSAGRSRCGQSPWVQSRGRASLGRQGGASLRTSSAMRPARRALPRRSSSPEYMRPAHWCWACPGQRMHVRGIAVEEHATEAIAIRKPRVHVEGEHPGGGMNDEVLPASPLPQQRRQPPGREIDIPLQRDQPLKLEEVGHGERHDMDTQISMPRVPVNDHLKTQAFSV